MNILHWVCSQVQMILLSTTQCESSHTLWLMLHLASVPSQFLKKLAQLTEVQNYYYSIWKGFFSDFFIFVQGPTYFCVIEGKGDIFQFSTIWVSKHVAHDLWNIWTYKPITDIADSSSSVNNREPKWRWGWEIFLNWIF